MAGNTESGYPKFHNVEAVSQNFYKFKDYIKSWIKASLKYVDWYIRETGTMRWKKVFYWTQMESDNRTIHSEIVIIPYPCKDSL